jgi:hypothetical protein
MLPLMMISFDLAYYSEKICEPSVFKAPAVFKERSEQDRYCPRLSNLVKCTIFRQQVASTTLYS